MTSTLIKTRLLVMRPDQPHETLERDLPEEPSYQELRDIITPLLDGAALEHVYVLADFAGGTDFKRADMFVDEMSLVRRLPRNEAATVIYRRNSMLREPGKDPESMSWIAGPAVLFDRVVWF
jgi:hypothetical protein